MQTSSGVQSHTTGSIALLTRSLTSGPLEVIAWQSLGRPTRPNISPARECPFRAPLGEPSDVAHTPGVGGLCSVGHRDKTVPEARMVCPLSACKIRNEERAYGKHNDEMT